MKSPSFSRMFSVIVLTMSIITLIQAERLEPRAPPYTFDTPGDYTLDENEVTNDLDNEASISSSQWAWPTKFDNHNRYRRSTATTHSNHGHTRQGKCFFGDSSSGFESFQQPSFGGNLPIFDIDPRYANVPIPYNILRSNIQPQPSEQNKRQQPQPTGPYPFTYRIVGRN